jgi:AbrB family looped-hinge helix DNA binding protein
MVSITAQGQLSLPAKVRQQFGLHKATKAIIAVENNKITLTPVSDIFSLRGVFGGGNQPSLSKKQIREAFEEYLAEQGANVEEEQAI